MSKRLQQYIDQELQTEPITTVPPETPISTEPTETEVETPKTTSPLVDTGDSIIPDEVFDQLGADLRVTPDIPLVLWGLLLKVGLELTILKYLYLKGLVILLLLVLVS